MLEILFYLLIVFSDENNLEQAWCLLSVVAEPFEGITEE